VVHDYARAAWRPADQVREVGQQVNPQRTLKLLQTA
jgi:hypothetical protein